MQPLDAYEEQLNDAEAQLNDKLKASSSETILGSLDIDIGTISNVTTAGSYCVQVSIIYSHYRRKFRLHDNATEYMDAKDSKLVLNTKFRLELHEIRWPRIDFSLMKHVTTDHQPTMAGILNFQLADLVPHKVMTFKEPLGDGSVMSRVETNPHQTLIRLKNNIVFLSRIKVGFNPGHELHNEAGIFRYCSIVDKDKTAKRSDTRLGVWPVSIPTANSWKIIIAD